jgi:hypothetical protein
LTGGCSPGGRSVACCTMPLHLPPATGSGERGTARAARSSERRVCTLIASRYEKTARQSSPSPREPRRRSTCAALVPLRCKVSARPAPGKRPARNERHFQRSSARGERLQLLAGNFLPVQRPHAAALTGAAAMAEDSGELVSGTVSWFSVIKGYGARRGGRGCRACLWPLPRPDAAARRLHHAHRRRRRCVRAPGAAGLAAAWRRVWHERAVAVGRLAGCSF